VKKTDRSPQNIARAAPEKLVQFVANEFDYIEDLRNMALLRRVFNHNDLLKPMEPASPQFVPTMLRQMRPSIRPGIAGMVPPTSPDAQ
jgi:hypothetical protein